jgi:hypothetical protein
MLLGAINPTFGDDNHEMDIKEPHCDKTKSDVDAAVTMGYQHSMGSPPHSIIAH